MACFSDQRSSARKFPASVVRRMGTAVRLLSPDPENLRAAFHHNLSLLLNGRRIDPVLGITDLLAAAGCGSEKPFATLHAFIQHLLLWISIASEIGHAGAKVSGEGLFDDDVLPQGERLNRKLLVGSGRCAEVDHVHCCAQLCEGCEGLDLLLPRKCVARLRRSGRHSHHLDGHAVNPVEALPVEASGEARSHNPDANWVLHQTGPPLQPELCRPSARRPFLAFLATPYGMGKAQG